MVIVHHTASFNTMEESISSEKRHRGNIPYHFLIGSDGEIRQMRALSENPGATKNKTANRDGIQISLIGNFNYGPPSMAQRKSLKKLIDRFDLPVKLHRDVGKTACPGKFFTF